MKKNDPKPRQEKKSKTSKAREAIVSRPGRGQTWPTKISHDSELVQVGGRTNANRLFDYTDVLVALPTMRVAMPL